MNELNLLKELLQDEIDNTIIKTDTYTKGKFAGIRKAMVLIEDIQQGYYTDKLRNESEE